MMQQHDGAGIPDYSGDTLEALPKLYDLPPLVHLNRATQSGERYLRHPETGGNLKFCIALPSTWQGSLRVFAKVFDGFKFILHSVNEPDMTRTPPAAFFMSGAETTLKIRNEHVIFTKGKEARAITLDVELQDSTTQKVFDSKKLPIKPRQKRSRAITIQEQPPPVEQQQLLQTPQPPHQQSIYQPQPQQQEVDEDDGLLALSYLLESPSISRGSGVQTEAVESRVQIDTRSDLLHLILRYSSFFALLH